MDIVNIIWSVLFAIFTIGGSLYLLGGFFAMWRSTDALVRLNQLSAAVAVGVPFLIVANLILEISQGVVDFGDVVTAAVAIASILVVASVSSEMLGRAALGARDGSAEDYDPNEAKEDSTKARFVRKRR